MAANNTIDAPGYMTEGQQIVMLAGQSTSSFLSIVGSSSIAYIIIKGKEWRNGLYHRIMLGLSIADAVVSTGLLITPYLEPSTEVELVGAIGNTATCTFAGLLVQTTMCANWYNASLAFFFYAMVRSRRKNANEEAISRKFECLLHGIPICLFAICTTLAVILRVINPAEFTRQCTIAGYPVGCDADGSIPCTRGANYLLFRFVLVCLLTTPAVASSFFTAKVYCHVRRTLLANERYRFEGDEESQKKKKREVAVRSVLYLLAYLNSFCWIVAASLLGVFGVPRDRASEPGVYAILFVCACMWPLQGFFNALIYIHPRYAQWSKKLRQDQQCPEQGLLCNEPHLKRFEIIRKVFSGKPLPSTSSKKRKSTLSPSHRSTRARNSFDTTVASSQTTNSPTTHSVGR